MTKTSSPDEDVITKHEFLAATLPGTSETLDAELDAHIFAQQALASTSDSSSCNDAKPTTV